MVWGASMEHLTSQLAMLRGSPNSLGYTRTIENYLLTIASCMNAADSTY